MLAVPRFPGSHTYRTCAYSRDQAGTHLQLSERAEPVPSIAGSRHGPFEWAASPGSSGPIQSSEAKNPERRGSGGWGNSVDVTVGERQHTPDFAGVSVQDLYAEFKAVVQALNAKGIPYAVCGGLAFAIHVRPRATVDMDFLIQTADLGRCQHVLSEIGYTPHPKPMTFAGGLVVIQRLWNPQERGGDVLTIDLLVVNDEAMPGVWDSCEEMHWEGLAVRVVSRDGLIALKRLRGSKQDFADIELLTDPGVHE